MDGFDCGLEDRGVSRQAKIVVIGEGKGGGVARERTLGMICSSALFLVGHILKERLGGWVHLELSVAKRGG